MAFHNVRFPEDISYGSRGGPKFKTTVLELASGYERRNQDWSVVKAEYDVTHGIKEPEQMVALRDFFYGRRGAAHSFRFKDWSDYQIQDQNIGQGDGTNRVFQIIKSYEDTGPNQYDRTITKPVQGTLSGLLVGGVAKVEGTDFDIDYSTGVLTFKPTKAPADGAMIIITDLEFDVHARFDTDHLDASHDYFNIQTWESIPVVEIKGAI
jgi:uncharacterized protein (TIGR02217 family)